MMNKIKFLIFMLLPFYITGQNVEFIKKNFKEDKEGFKKAMEEYSKGDEYFEAGQNGYKMALLHYLKANDFNPDNDVLNYKIGKCYLYSSTKIKAIPYLEKAYKLNDAVADDIHFLLGWAYQLNMEWDKAIKEYKLFYDHVPDIYGINREETEKLIRKRIKECKYGKELVQHPVRVFIDNIGEAINTKYPEYGPVISADESVLMFTSRRPSTTGGKMDPGLFEYYEDIYYSEKKNKRWTLAKNMGEPINTDEHDATVNLSPDGQKLLIYKDDNGDGNIYECVLNGNNWSKPKKLGKNINSKYHESSACYTYDMKTLYFVSNRPGGKGGRDIYYSNWDEKKQQWGEAKNIGSTINTEYNEESVFMHPDGVTMYFSSQGHNTMGGYDIFKTVYDKKTNRWSEPENLGYPINTPDDDVFFVLSASGRRGYFSSFRPEGYGEKDIYIITFLGPEKPLILSSEDNLIAMITSPVKEKVIEPPVDLNVKKITILKGLIREAKTLKPIEAQIELIDIEDNAILASFKSNKETGKYLVSMPSGKNYGIAVKAKGYLPHSENFNISEDEAFKEIEKNIELQPLEVGSTVILKNIFFDYDKATLRPESTNELQRVIKLMNDNPTIKVEISGHTDSRGSDDYNQKLSENRAKSVVEYLVQHGIDKNRLTFKGYGEMRPIAPNDTEEGRQKNRRVEFKILSK